MAAAPDRQKALDAALAQIDKQFGKGSVMRLGDEVRAPIEVIPTGSIALDVAQPHDRTLAELLVNLCQCCVERLLTIRGCRHGSHL